MSNQQKKLQKLDQLLAVLTSEKDYVTTEEFSELLKVVADAIKGMNSKFDSSVVELESVLAEALSQGQATLDTSKAELSSEVKSKLETAVNKVNELARTVREEISKIKLPKDGETPSDEKLLELITPLIPKLPEVKIPDTKSVAIDAVNLIENFEGDDRLDYKALKNTPDIKGLILNNKIAGGGGNTEIYFNGGKIGSGQGINFIGSGVSSVTHDGHRATVNITGGGGGAETFLDLTDTPANYTGAAQRFVKVNAAGDGLEFVAGSGAAVAWGDITGTLSDQTDLQTALDGKVDENSAITGATKTKITYDAKGLVTAGADATTADIADSTDARYVTDAQLTVIGNTSGTNTGDQDLSGKQDVLVSGTNIKTINSTSLLGSGNIDTPNTTYTAGTGLQLTGTEFSSTITQATRDSLGLDTDDTVTFANLSGTNTGDQDISGKADTSGALTQFVGNGNHKVFYSNGSGDVTELTLGADGTYLKSNGATSAPSFDTPAGGSGDVATDSIWDAKGDLAGGTGSNTAARLAVGTNGQILMADSTQTTGLKWEDVEDGLGIDRKMIVWPGNTFFPSSGGTVFISYVGSDANEARARVYVPTACTLKKVYFRWIPGSEATTETSTLSVRVNNTTDHLVRDDITAVAAASWDNTNMSVSLSAGDFFTLKLECPSWSTFPTGSNIKMITMEFESVGNGVSELNDIPDVDIDTPTDGQVLTYDGDTSTWINATGGGGGFTDFDISDGTNTQTIEDGNTLTFTDGNGISAVVGATDTVTLAADINGATDLATPAVGDEILLADVDASNVIRKSDIGTVLDLYNSRTATMTGKTLTNPALTSQALSDGATISWDWNSGTVATVTLGGNRTLATPTNLKAGHAYLKVTQDGTGGRTLDVNTNYNTPGGINVTLTTTAGAVDILEFMSDGTNVYLVNITYAQG